MSKAFEPFCKLDWELIDCEAYRALSAVARAALVELCRCHNGRNNGRISAPVRWLGARLGVAYKTAARALRELADLGFVRVAQAGGFNTKNTPACYTLTCSPCGSEPATKDYLSVQPLVEEPFEIPKRSVTHDTRSVTHDTGVRAWRHAQCHQDYTCEPDDTAPVSPMTQSIDLRSARRSLPPAPAGGLVGSVSAGAGGVPGPAAVIPSDPPSAGAEPVASIAGTYPSAQPADPSDQRPAGSGSGSKPAVEPDWLLGGPNIVFFPSPSQRGDDASAVVADAG